MALVKTVEMRILANAGDAQAKLDELDAKAKQLDSNAIRMRFRVDDAEGKAQLDAIRAKADLLGFKDVTVKVKVDGAGLAIAELAAVRHEEEKTARTGLFSRLIGGAGGAIPGSGGLPLIGSVPLPALAAAVPLAGALAVELTGVASGFAAAATGAGAFALLARPAITQVQTAYQGLHAAQQKYTHAQALQAEAPSKAHASALAAAKVNLDIARDSIAKLPASEQAAVKGIDQLAAGFGKISKAFQPQAFKVFADGLKVIGNLLPHLTQFATPFAGAIDGLLQRLAKFTASKGFSDWLAKFSKDVGPAVTSIGEGIGKVAGAFGKLMTVMSSKDVAHAINIGFGAISGTIGVVTFAIRRFMQNFDGMKAAATSAVNGTVAAFKSMASGVASAVGAVIGAWKTMVSAIGTGVTTAVSFVSQLPVKIKGFFSDAIGWLVQAGKNIIQGLINGIGSMVGAIGGAIGGIVAKIRSFLPFSPAKEGPLSGLGSPELAGRAIAAMLAGGMDQGRPGVAQAAGRLAGAAAGTAGMAGAYGRGGGEVHLHLEAMVHTQDSVRQAVQALREYKRHGGGTALGIA